MLGKLKTSAATIILKKYRFLTSVVKFLGFMVTPEGNHKDTDYVQKSDELTASSNFKSLQRILGLLNWCEKLVDEYAAKAQPLCDLLRQGKSGNGALNIVNVGVDESGDET